MTNRILDVVILNHRQDPVETELRVYVKVEHLTPTTEVRARLMGPRCPYASTIEIAHPLREIARSDHVELRVVIPEPSWWDPQTPFRYDGELQLMQDGQVCEEWPLHHGIRWLQMTSKGLRLNGQPFAIRGRIIEEPLSPGAAQSLRDQGINTLLTRRIDSDLAHWDIADRLGFFVIGTSPSIDPFLQHRNELSRHACNFGWIFSRTDFLASVAGDPERGMLYGVNTSAAGELPGADFVCCHERELAWLEEVKLPKLVVNDKEPAKRADLIGWIRSAS